MSRRAGILIAALAVATLVACQSGQRKRRQKLTFYCSAQIEWCELVKTAFARQTGIKVAMTRKSTGELLAQIKAERRNPKGDVWWGGTGDGHIQAAASRLTEPYRSPLVDQLHPWARDPVGRGEHRMTGIYMGALGFGCNHEWLAKKNLPVPAGWRDLIKPIYRGEVQMANPNSSGTAYTALATVVQLFGEEEAFDYLAKLHMNINQYTKSGSAPVRAAARGETGIGIVFLHDAVTQKVANFPISEVLPVEKTGFEIGGVSIIRGARHPASARRFVDFALTPQAQALAIEAAAYQLPSNVNAPIPPLVPRFGPDQLIDFDFAKYGSKAERARLLKRWEREVKVLPR